MSEVEIDYASHAVEWESSKQNQKSYCRNHEINYSKFVEARSKLQASRGMTRAKPKFIEVQPKKVPTPLRDKVKAVPTKSMNLTFPNGSVLDIPLNLNPEQYSNVFSGLKVLL